MLLLATGCTLTSNDYEPSVVGSETETGRLGPAAGAPPMPDPPAPGRTTLPPVLDPGEAPPPFDLAPTEADNQSSGDTLSGAEGTDTLQDAGAEPSDAGDAGDAGTSPRDAGRSPSDASSAEPTPSDASSSTNGPDASTSPTGPDASAPPNSECPGLVFEDSCYEFFAEQLSWADAEAQCVAWGGHLASVESADEDAFIGAWPAFVGIPFWDNSGLWLGGTDAQSDGEFRWLDDSELSFLGWAPDQPNNGQGVDCIEKRNDITQRWYDRRCIDGERYVCERPQ